MDPLDSLVPVVSPHHDSHQGAGSISSRATVTLTVFAAGGASSGSGRGAPGSSGRGRAWEATVYLAEVGETW